MGIRLCRSALSRKPVEARAMAALIGLETEVWTLTDLAASLRRERSGLRQPKRLADCISGKPGELARDRREAGYHHLRMGYLQMPNESNLAPNSSTYNYIAN